MTHLYLAILAALVASGGRRRSRRTWQRRRDAARRLQRALRERSRDEACLLCGAPSIGGERCELHVGREDRRATESELTAARRIGGVR